MGKEKVLESMCFKPGTYKIQHASYAEHGPNRFLTCHGTYTKRDDVSGYVIAHKRDSTGYDAHWNFTRVKDKDGKPSKYFKIQRAHNAACDKERFLASHGTFSKRDDVSGWAIAHEWDNDASTHWEVIDVGDGEHFKIKHAGGRFLSDHGRHSKRDEDSDWALVADSDTPRNHRGPGTGANTHWKLVRQ